ncbi:MAG: HPr(Ser) kinase/phosphatase [Simkania negevensis]|nr:HPr(Ser) kinase/phosphatase [Simkania negevensis]
MHLEKNRVYVQDLYKNHKELLALEKTKAWEGMEREILSPEVQRPGLSLAGYLKKKERSCLLIFGAIEIKYLRDLEVKKRLSRLREVITKDQAAVLISRGLSPLEEILALCIERKVPLFSSHLTSTALESKLKIVLDDLFAPSIRSHGTLVEAFGVGVLIEGESSVGKSETALALIERGHRLISDDLVEIRKKREENLEGTSPELTRYLLEIRGIGIINVAHLFGMIAVKKETRIDLRVKLEQWQETSYYDRVGLEEQFYEILGVKIPSYLLPVKTGRNLALLIETTVLNHRLKNMGFHTAKEFSEKLLEKIAKRGK